MHHAEGEAKKCEQFCTDFGFLLKEMGAITRALAADTHGKDMLHVVKVKCEDLDNLDHFKRMLRRGFEVPSPNPPPPPPSGDLEVAV